MFMLIVTRMAQSLKKIVNDNVQRMFDSADCHIIIKKSLLLCIAV